MVLEPTAGRRPTAADIGARRRRGTELMRAGTDAAAQLRVLSTFNLDLATPFLVEALDRHGFVTAVSSGAFGQITQEILDPGSDLYSRDTGDLLIVPAAEDLLPGVMDGTLSDLESQIELVDARLQELELALGQALERLPGATVYLAVYGPADAPNPHVLDPLDPQRGQVAIERFLTGVRGLGHLSRRIVLVDWDWHLRSIGAAGLTDERMWYLARMRLGPTGLSELSELVARHVSAYHGRACKVAALDLDGTLWGGVIGEMGVAGVEISEEGAGAAFRELQRELLRLHDTGVVLVACSKNNEADALAVFEQRAEMVLAPSHFASMRINWQDKATNLREIAEELSLGLDSFVFLDDNPVEREWIRQALPMVRVPELPQDPAKRPGMLRTAGLFERIALTGADRERARSYAAQGVRANLRAGSASYEDFLHSLEQVLTIEPVGESTLARAAQLCQRTNQFNLTNRRHTVADLEAALGSGRFELFTVAVRDRFVDSGVTGIVGLHVGAGAVDIDTFLLSCRVLGRRVEHALLALIASRARAHGVDTVRGRYVATPKNGQVGTFLVAEGIEPGPDGRFEVDLSKQEINMPEELAMEVNTGATAPP